MAIIEGIGSGEAARGGVVAIGNFDGVHRGHQAMMRVLRREADRLGAPAVAVTFDPPPVEVLRPGQSPPRLMTLSDKRELLRAAGADSVLVLPTSRKLLSLSARAFFEQVLRDELEVRGLVEGPNFRFGHGREGDVALLRELASEAGIPLAVVEPVEEGGLVSSSRIRGLVERGDLASAGRMLGRPHRVRGTVVRGAARGAELGFPTANLSGITVLLPPNGVYAGRTTIADRRYAAAIHLGPNSTFGEAESSVEVHLLDFDGDLYGQSPCIELWQQIRPTMTFNSREELVARMRDDCARVRDAAGEFDAGD